MRTAQDGYRVRVVHLIESLGLGGAERRLVSDLRWLDRQRYEHLVVYLMQADNLRAEIETMGIPTRGLGMRNLREWRVGLFRLARLFRRWRPRLVHTQVFGADVYGRVAATLAGVPRVVTTVQTLPYDRRLARFYSKRRKIADYLTARFWTDHFVAVSEPVRDALIAEFGIPPGRVSVIPNGVDLTRFCPRTSETTSQARALLGIPQEAFVILTVGRLIPEKNHATLVRAFEAGLGRLPHARLLLVGDGPCRRDLERLVRARELDGRVALLGARSDVDHLLRAADLFVLPSLREGLSVALLEAMGSEVPAIASAIPQNTAIIHDGQTGWLVPALDHVALAELIVQTARNRDNARVVARLARAHVAAHFSAETFARQLQDLYDELCTEIRGAGRISPALR